MIRYVPQIVIFLFIDAIVVLKRIIIKKHENWSICFKTIHGFTLNADSFVIIKNANSFVVIKNDKLLRIPYDLATFTEQPKFSSLYCSQFSRYLINIFTWGTLYSSLLSYAKKYIYTVFRIFTVKNHAIQMLLFDLIFNIFLL